MPITTPAAILLAAAGPSTAALSTPDRAALDAAVAAIYRPYADAENTRSAWEYPGFSRETAALIARWQKVVPEGELDGLNDGDWFCLCQDWQGLRAAVTGRELVRAGVARLRLRIELGPGAVRTARMTFVREKGGWKLDDIVARDFPRGLKQALRETIVADSRLGR